MKITHLNPSQIREMVDMIAVRNHIYTLVNGPRTPLISREEEKELRQFANDLDREVVERSKMMKNSFTVCATTEEDVETEDLPPQVAAQVKEPEPKKEAKPATRKVAPKKKKATKKMRKTPRDTSAMVEAMMKEGEESEETEKDKPAKKAKKGLVSRSKDES